MSLVQTYHNIIKNNGLRPDTRQYDVVQKLEALCARLRGQADTQKSRSWLPRRIFPLRPRATERQGIYLYGGVGSGKTMLMDLFYKTCPVQAKSRVHYNSFMLDVHSRTSFCVVGAFEIDRLAAIGLHALKQRSGTEPVRQYVTQFAEEVRLLCLDEFQVTDVADAMLLRNLLTCMLDAGLFFLITSNRHPRELYLNGLQRSSFVPCIDLLEGRLEVVNLSAERDYRTLHETSADDVALAVSPIDGQTSKFMEQCLISLCRGGEPGPRVLYTLGRPIHVTNGCGNVVAKFSFDELCSRPLSAADYICIASSFRTVLLTDVPILTFSLRDEARRFITLIDIFYDHRTQLILQSEAPPGALFQLQRRPEAMTSSVRSLADDLLLAGETIVTFPLFLDPGI